MSVSRMTQEQLKAARRQIQMVIDLNKCIGCQGCTVACKTCWTDGEGQEYMYWNNVETKPGRGYPRDWEHKGGGYDAEGHLLRGRLPAEEDYGIPWQYNYKAVEFEGTEKELRPHVRPTWGPNWEEDVGAGTYPFDNFYFYLPKLCVHCTNPPCVDVCPENAIYKREEDGVVLISEDLCKGHKECIRACPYGEIYFNEAKKVSQKCVFCFPRIEEGIAPACCKQCIGRCHFVSYADDADSPVYKLVKKWQVALPLHPEFNTQPNVFYVPPILCAAMNGDGTFSSEPRVPLAYLRSLFGPEVDRALETLKGEREKRRRGEPSELMDILIAYRFDEMFKIPSRVSTPVQIRFSGRKTLNPTEGEL